MLSVGDNLGSFPSYTKTNKEAAERHSETGIQKWSAIVKKNP